MLVLAVSLLVPPDSRAEIRLEVTAAEGKLPAAAKANVIAWLSLSRYRQRDDLDETLILRLQQRASREAGRRCAPSASTPLPPSPQCRQSPGATASTGARESAWYPDGA